MSSHRSVRRRCAAAIAAAGLTLAIPAARAQVEVGIAETRPAEPAAERSSDTLLSEAATQMALDELDTAQASYLAAIDQIIATDGEFAAALIDAYRGLAETLARRGDYPEAITTLEQARHISNRRYGLFNLDQTEILDELSVVYENAGETRKAQDAQREILDVAVRHFGGEVPGTIPYHFRLARYFELARMRVLAREQYATALEILDDDSSTRPEATLRPLRELVRIDTQLGEQTGTRRRLTETLATTPDAEPVERAESLATLGDAALATGAIETALDRYADAYAALEAQNRDEFFRSPRMINFVPPPAPVDWGRSRDRPYAWGSITLTFSLTSEGKARDISVVDANPPGLMDARYVERLAEARFRPRLAGGRAVETPRLRYFHEFRYYLPETD